MLIKLLELWIPRLAWCALSLAGGLATAVALLLAVRPPAAVQASAVGPAGLSPAPDWVAPAPGTGSFFGNDVATAGDVNGDGYADVIIGDFTDNGRAYIYTGTASGLGLTPAVTLTGEITNSSFGGSVSTAGDVNADGYSDVVVGDLTYDNDTGQAYLYLGGPGGPSPTPAFTATGRAPNSQLGYPVRTAGDVNGDGYADVFIGEGLTNTAYVFLGGADGLTATRVITLTGPPGEFYYGLAGGTAGDVNADGYSDILVGAFGYNSFTGRAYVYLGAPAGLDLTPVFTATGENAGSNLGMVTGPAGDVNGDGYADIVIAAPGYLTSTGRAYIYLGAPGGVSAAPALTLTGEAPGTELGFSRIETAGDVNGDGYADLLVSAHGHPSGSGRAYVHYGGPGGLAPTPAITYTGELTNSAFGAAVSTAGDVNGDGYGDIIIGAEFYNFPTLNGRAYVYHGGPDPLSSQPAFTAAGQGAERLGRSVASAGDVNGDGYADALIGAPSFLSGTGQVYLHLGSASGLSSTPAFTAAGETPNSFFGFPARTAGDVNGDGYSDVIVGAAGYLSSTGRAYLYLGSASGLSPTPAFSATGQSVNDQFGAMAGTAGDVNGDGYQDVVVSGNLSVYVYHGSAVGLSASPAFTAAGAASPGLAAGTAGDVNGDGYSDLIVGDFLYNGNTGRAHLYLGSSSGLVPMAALTYTGLSPNDYFGKSAGAAGDVDGDGYADLLIGADQRMNLYPGGPAGPSPTPAFTATGQLAGFTGGSAGDVNGDGYADVVLGAPSSSDQVLVYAGSAAGLSPAPILTLTDATVGGLFGESVGAAGDVNGDGYADWLAGGSGMGGSSGRAFLHAGNGGYGLSLVVQQRRADDTAPIAHLGQSGSAGSFRLAALGRSPFGRGRVKLEWEVKPLGTPLDGTGTQQSAAWLDTGAAGAALDELVTGLAANTPYHWRVRLRYHQATTPFQQYSRWLTQPWNGQQEADLRTAPLSGNVAPAALDDAYSLDEDSPLAVAAPGVLANDHDPNADPFSAVLTTPPLAGALSLNPNGSFSYTPALNFNGVITFAYHAHDGAAASSPAVVTLTVAPVNDPPSVSEVAGQMMPLNTSLGPIPVTIGDVDAGDVLTLTASSSNPALLPDENIVLGGSGFSRTVTLTPAPNRVGVTTVTLSVSDGQESASSSFLLEVVGYVVSLPFLAR